MLLFAFSLFFFFSSFVFIPNCALFYKLHFFFSLHCFIISCNIWMKWTGLKFIAKLLKFNGQFLIFWVGASELIYWHFALLRLTWNWEFWGVWRGSLDAFVNLTLNIIWKVEIRENWNIFWWLEKVDVKIRVTYFAHQIPIPNLYSSNSTFKSTMSTINNFSHKNFQQNFTNVTLKASIIELNVISIAVLICTKEHSQALIFLVNFTIDKLHWNRNYYS